MNGVAQLLTRWNTLPRALRLAVGAAVLAMAIIAAAAAIVAHPARTPLFAASLHPEQLAEVEERLAAWNVAFTPTAENVIVDARRRNDLLLRLSLAGVPHLHLVNSAEALESIGVLTPQAVIEAQTRAGLAGDIEAGLRSIDGVDDVRVIVAPAKAAEFADETMHDASASVRLQLRGGERLPREAIAGIRAFVAASVHELRPARVTILDDRGVALGDDTAGADEAAELQRSLQSALDSVFGDEATIVRVRAEYEVGQTSEHDVRRAPIAVAAIRRLRRSESYDGGGKRYRRLEEGDDRGSQTHESLAQTPAGALKRLSTAIFVDQSRALDVPKVRELAGATLGYDPRRGDTLAVEAVDFHRELPVRKDLWWLLYGAIVPHRHSFWRSGSSLAFGSPYPRSQRSCNRSSSASSSSAPRKPPRVFRRRVCAACSSKNRRMPRRQSSARSRLQPPRQSWTFIRRTNARRSFAECSGQRHLCSPTRTSYCVVMSENFVPLAAFLRPVARNPVVEPPPLAEAPTADLCDDYNETLRAARRFRAGLSDALETAVEQLLPRIAKEVLARELQLADADVAAILSAALDRFAGDAVLCVRAHPHDWAALAGLELERVADGSLQPGDIRLELRSGTIDLTLAARLDAALAVCSA